MLVLRLGDRLLELDLRVGRLLELPRELRPQVLPPALDRLPHAAMLAVPVAVATAGAGTAPTSSSATAAATPSRSRAASTSPPRPPSSADVVGPERELDGSGHRLVEARVEQPGGGLRRPAATAAIRSADATCAWSASTRRRRVRPTRPPPSRPRAPGGPSRRRGCDRVVERVAAPGDAPALAGRRRRCARRSRRAGRGSGPASARRATPCRSGAARRAHPCTNRRHGSPTAIGSIRSGRSRLAGQPERDARRAQAQRADPGATASSGSPPRIATAAPAPASRIADGAVTASAVLRCFRCSGRRSTSPCVTGSEVARRPR